MTPGVAMPQRFHLRDAQAGMPAADWQEAFATLWPLLRPAQLSPLALFTNLDEPSNCCCG
ncbi:MAG: hypothetical protein ACR5LG_09955 [Sodalis sp. (in: enterobacteria)]|uniref:hypothetical protein n=1 Tax=Sodalis sp. (in: enterobacteria) TaxID=1898979 RepID=UPI003F3D055A